VWDRCCQTAWQTRELSGAALETQEDDFSFGPARSSEEFASKHKKATILVKCSVRAFWEAGADCSYLESTTQFFY